MPHFNTNYFGPNEAVWRNLMRRARWDFHAPKTIVEIGSYEGASAYWILENLLLSPDSRLYCIDAWDGAADEARFELFQRNIAEMTDSHRVTTLRSRSDQALVRLVAEGVRADLLYVDGGHAAPTVLSDLVLGFQIVKPDGIIICDDYLWADPAHGGASVLGRPKIAIDAFTTIFGDKLTVIPGMSNSQVFLRKDCD